MSNRSPDPEFRSAERLAFEIYLRTGQRAARPEGLERKFNPYHDPQNGQFTFAPGGPRSINRPIFSDKRGLWKGKQALALKQPSAPTETSPSGRWGAPVGARIAESGRRTDWQAVAHSKPNPRARIGGNGGPPLSDPMTITRAIPGLQNSPAATIIAVPMELFDLTGPARAATAAVHTAYRRKLIRQIEAIDPNYTYRAVSTSVHTLQSQLTEINILRFDRAMALYRIRGDANALQVEVLRFVQERVDAAYDQGVAKFDAGELSPRLSRNEAIGNFIDRTVRADLRERFNRYAIDHTAGPIRVVGREYDTSTTPSSYVVPDAAVTNAAFDWSLQRKTPGTRQLRGFFNSDFRPDLTMIIRPSQLGPGHTYVIKAGRR